MARNKTTYILSVDDKGTPRIKQFAGDAKREMKSLESTTTSVSSNMGTAMVGAAAAMTAAIYGFAKAARASIEAAQTQAKAVMGMEASLKSMGRYTPELSKNLQEFASELQSVTNIGDEVTLVGVKLLSMFTSIGTEQLPAATEAMLNFSEAMGVDLRAASRAMGQAAEGNIGQLQRYGVILDKGKLEAEGFAHVLEVMEQKFGGQARVMRDATGPWTALKNTIGDTTEELGAFTNFALAPYANDMIKLTKAMQQGWGNVVEKIREAQRVELEFDIGRLQKELATQEVGVDLGGVGADFTIEGLSDEAIEARKAKLAELQLALDRLIDPKGTGGGDGDGEGTAFYRTDQELSAIKQKAQTVFDEVTNAETNMRSWIADNNRAVAEEKRQIAIEEADEGRARAETEMAAWIEQNNREAAVEKQRQEESERMRRIESYQRRQAMAATMQNLELVAQTFGKKHKEMFRVMQAMAIAETVIDTYHGAQEAYTALAGIPIVGPALGTAAAAAAIVAGMARVQAISRQKPQAEFGGVFAGPKEGYDVELHGTEAVVPLPDGRSIPVEMKASEPGISFGSLNVTIVATDAASVEELMHRNPNAVLGVVKEALISGDKELLALLN